jgi:hypothetical protein
MTKIRGATRASEPPSSVAAKHLPFFTTSKKLHDQSARPPRLRSFAGT